MNGQDTIVCPQCDTRTAQRVPTARSDLLPHYRCERCGVVWVQPIRGLAVRCQVPEVHALAVPVERND